MSTRPTEPLPVLHGVSLAQYAAVQAGLGEGDELDAVLEREGLDPAVWPDAEDAWSDRMLEDLEDEGPLQTAFDEHLAEAQDRLGRAVPPLDEDLAAWLDFVRIWAADAEPVPFLERLGLRPSDVIRLQRRWSARLGSEPALQEEAKEILERPPGELATPRPAPRAKAAARAPAAVEATAGGEEEPALFGDLASWIAGEAAVDPTRIDPLAEPQTLPAAPSPFRRAPALPFAAARPAATPFPPPKDPSTPAPTRPDPSVDPETLPPMTSPFRRGAELPFKGALPSHLKPAEPSDPASTPGKINLGETSAIMMSPFARELPFLTKKETPSAPLPPAGSAPAPAKKQDLGATGVVDATAALAAALPFMKSKAPATTAPATASPAPATPVAPMAAPPAPPAALPTGADAPPPSKGTAALSLAQYASLCAELTVFPTATEQTFQRYGLAIVARRLSVDLAWQERLRRNPAEYAEWQRLYQHYQAYFRSAGR